MCIGLLSAEFSTVNTGSGRPMFWKPLCLLGTPEGRLATIKLLTYTDYLNFQPRISTFSKKSTKNIRSLKSTADFIFYILKAMTALYCVSQCTGI